MGGAVSSGEFGKIRDELARLRELAESAQSTAIATNAEVDARGLPSQELASRVTAGLRVVEKRLDHNDLTIGLIRDSLSEARRQIERNELFIKGDPTKDRPGAAEDLRSLKRWVGRLEKKLEEFSAQDVVVEAKLPEQSIELEIRREAAAEKLEWSRLGREFVKALKNPWILLATGLALYALARLGVLGETLEAFAKFGGAG